MVFSEHAPELKRGFAVPSKRNVVIISGDADASCTFAFDFLESIPGPSVVELASAPR